MLTEQNCLLEQMDDSHRLGSLNANFLKLPEFLYPATKVWRGIMLYPSVSVRPSVLTISDR